MWKNITLTVYILVSLTMIIILMYLLQECKKKEGFCGTCQGIGNKICPNRELIHTLYNDGKLTEFTTSDQATRPWSETSWDMFFDKEEHKKSIVNNKCS